MPLVKLLSAVNILYSSSPPRKMFLPAVVNHFPKYNSESLQACLQLFLVLEILQYSSARAINVFSFFPPSFASKWMKGIYRIGTETDVVHKNLQNKRTEVHIYWGMYMYMYTGVCTMYMYTGVCTCTYILGYAGVHLRGGGGGGLFPPTTGLAPSRIKKFHFKYNCTFITIQLLLKL